jgi:hypothetical protein
MVRSLEIKYRIYEYKNVEVLIDKKVGNKNHLYSSTRIHSFIPHLIFFNKKDFNLYLYFFELNITLG